MTVAVSCNLVTVNAGIQVFLTHTLNAGYEINVSWYPVSSKLTNYVCEHCRLFEDYSYPKLLTLAHIC